MTEESVTVLDHIEGITVPGDVFAEPANEYWQLVCMRKGMEHLHRQAAHWDQQVRQQGNLGGNVKRMGLGNLPAFRGIPKPLVTCAFHWYAMSAYQYVLTVGAIAHRQDNARPIPPHYVRDVIPEVLAFRDKVAAHFAWAKNNSRDTEADRLASILPPLGLADDSIHVALFAVVVRQSSKTSNSQALRPWSICRVHEQLRKRYWPHQEQQDKEPLEQTNAGE